MSGLPSDPHFIRRHGGWFRPNAQGYTTDLSRAGIYSGAVARQYLDVEGLTIHPAASVMDQVRTEAASLEERAVQLRALLRHFDTPPPTTGADAAGAEEAGRG